ncbi:hypothetical protein BBFL7_00847 [Flavobacteria bacterium BBFL7]|nr:hypothetical protein BBFL7_00847 [Flavobacteria bacterium BBFL7]
MIFLDKNSHKILHALDIHKRDMLVRINQFKSHASVPIEIRDFFTDDRILKLLISEPRDLIDLNENFLNDIPSHSFAEWNQYLLLKKRTRDNPAEIALFDKYQLLERQLNLIFRYSHSIESSKFTAKTIKKYSAYHLADNLDIQTCVYCNRIYTKTVTKPHKTTRPQFDHWFPKSRYPMLALSFFNLIPSCNICNSSLKGDVDFNIDTMIHPYIHSDIKMKFSYRLNSYAKQEFKINRVIGSEEDQTINAFKLEEIYKTHEDELDDLILLKKRYSLNYLLNLRKILNPTKERITVKELYRLAFGVYPDEKDFHKRPLSKMKRDILEELKMKID